MTAPGWFQAPNDPPTLHRWWDGRRWTPHTQPAPAPRPKTPPAPRKVAAIPYRVAARVFDLMLFLALAWLANRLWVPRVLDSEMPNLSTFVDAALFPVGDGFELQTTVLAATALMGLMWELFWLLSEGATPGKQLLGLFVHDPASRLGRVEPIAAIKRNIHRVVNLIPFGSVIVGLLSLASLVLMAQDRERRQSVMDRFADTTVYRLPPGSPRFTPWLRVAIGLAVAFVAAGWILDRFG